MRFREREEKGGEKEWIEELIWKLLQLDIKDDSYTIVYAQLFVIALGLVEKLLILA